MGRLLVAVCIGSCTEAPAPVPARAPATEFAPASAATSLPFALADLAMPARESDLDLDPYYAPLIYLETGGRAHFGRLVDRSSELSVDSADPTVYYADDFASLHGTELRQLSFVWFRALAPGITPQGLRMTFDSTGYPAVFELLSGDGAAPQIFVSDSLEARAVEQFGAPDPSTQYAADNADDAIAIAGTLPVGPAPTGPYIYQSAHSVEIPAVHCRCEPSQVESIRDTIEYRLVPLELAEPLWSPKTLFGESNAALQHIRWPDGG